MDQYEMSHSKGAEIPSYQQTDENDARVLQNLGYKQQLNRKFGFMSVSLQQSWPPVSFSRRGEL
jgi:hypothetical protein